MLVIYATTALIQEHPTFRKVAESLQIILNLEVKMPSNLRRFFRLITYLWRYGFCQLDIYRLLLVSSLGMDTKFAQA